MKKVVSILTLTIMAILTCAVPVSAADPTFAVTSEIDKVYGVAQSKEVTIYFTVDNFRNFESSTQGGINVFEGTLVFDDEVFEPITSDSSGVVTSTTLSGEKSIMTQSGWAGLTYNSENKRLVIEKSTFVSKQEVILQVTLKVKATAQVGEATVKLVDMRASDQSKDIYTSNSEVVQKIEISSAISGETDGYIRILPDMKVSEFIQLHPATKTITGLSNNTLSADAYIPTGAKTSDGFILIAVGDINSDGKLTATDLSQLKAFEVGLIKNLNDNQKRAADIKWDAKYSTVDRSQLRIMMVKLGDPKISTWYGASGTTATCKPVEPQY